MAIQSGTARISGLVRTFLEENAPAGITVEWDVTIGMLSDDESEAGFHTVMVVLIVIDLDQEETLSATFTTPVGRSNEYMLIELRRAWDHLVTTRLDHVFSEGT